eukprot:symbB.v1.2.013423.t1/scaffold946.1/size149779/2
MRLASGRPLLALAALWLAIVAAQRDALDNDTESDGNTSNDTNFTNETEMLVVAKEVYVPTVDDIPSVSNVAFVDNDLDALQIAGTVSWTPPSDVSLVTGYRVYLCEGSLCSSRAQLGSHVSFSTVAITQAQTHIAVYSKLSPKLGKLPASFAEQTTPVTIAFVDEQTTAGNISFQDIDVDAGQVAGNVTWDQANTAQVTGYALYLGTASTKDVKLGEVCLISSGVEQSACDPYLFLDVAEGVSNVAFTGQDLDLNELGGLITWSPASWVVYTQEYLVYLGEDATGTSRSQVESAVPVGTNQLQLSADTPRLNYTHFLVYAKTVWQDVPQKFVVKSS